MKKSVSFCLMLVAIVALKAQTVIPVSSEALPLVYHLPATELTFKIEVEKTTFQPGIFYLYSQRYLSTDQVILEEKTNFRVLNVLMEPKTYPDLNRRYVVSAKGKSALNRIQVDEMGILTGINIPKDELKKEIRKEIFKDERQIRSAASGILPLTQEYMMAGSTAKLAEGAAKQIYMIRESRLNLLSGETEQMPQDGAALKEMLEGLDRLEKELTELFVGKVIVERSMHQVTYNPQSHETEEVLFRLSARRGFVDKEDLGGEPYFININAEKTKLADPDPKAKPQLPGLFTVLPALTNVKITNGINELFSRKLFIPQLGIVITYPESAFKSIQTKVLVDRNTGRLMSIE